MISVEKYGHTHLPIDMTLEGIRYVQWPLGYAKEHEFNCKESKRYELHGDKYLNMYYFDLLTNNLSK